MIHAYAKVRDNLLRVSPDYPEASALLNLVGESVALYGMDGVGEGHDSDGSQRLIKAIDKVDEGGRPLHVGLWGGANCLAQVRPIRCALGLNQSADSRRPYGVSVKTGELSWYPFITASHADRARSPDEVQAFVDKIVVYAISDQDDAGPWIRRHFPKVRFVVSIHGENVYMGATSVTPSAAPPFRADPELRWIAFASQPMNKLPGASAELISKDWIKTNVQIGPLGTEYPDVVYGMEGDTPSYLGCIPVSSPSSAYLRGKS